MTTLASISSKARGELKSWVIPRMPNELFSTKTCKQVTETSFRKCKRLDECEITGSVSFRVFRCKNTKGRDVEVASFPSSKECSDALGVHQKLKEMIGAKEIFPLEFDDGYGHPNIFFSYTRIHYGGDGLDCPKAPVFYGMSKEAVEFNQPWMLGYFHVVACRKLREHLELVRSNDISLKKEDRLSSLRKVEQIFQKINGFCGFPAMQVK